MPSPLTWIDPWGLVCKFNAKNPKALHSAIQKQWGHKMTAAEMREVQKTINNIKLRKPVIEKDGFPYKNNHESYPNDQRLNTKDNGYYERWTVKTPGIGKNGKQRIIVNNKTGEAFYTHDHYESFVEINIKGWN